MAILLQRHDLVWLSAAGWDHAIGKAGDAQAAACMAEWARLRLPLVVARREEGAPDLALGLAAPLEWERRKIAIRVPPTEVLFHDRFPKAREVARLLPPGLRVRWRALWEALAGQGVEVRVHGSFGWQALTGKHHVLRRSDLDLLLPVTDADSADHVASLLDEFQWSGPRIDGELLFPDGGAVAWREWLQLRRGAVDRILVKRLHGVSLETGSAWLACRCVAQAA
jgi:phosphoribosyl-dephospho-CoA transferase